MDQPKLARLMRLMKMLTGNFTYSVPEIAQRLEMSDRTVYRYIDTFRDGGFVIKKHDNNYRIDKSSPYFKDISSLIHFTNEEAYILKSAIENIDENNLIKQNLKKKLATVYDYKILAETIVKGKNARNVNQLVSAIENKQQVYLHEYSSAHGHDVRTRYIEPFAFTANYIQLWAYEPESGKNKLFKLSRIGEVALKNTVWQHESKHREGFLDIFRLSSEEQLPVKLQMSLRAAQLLIEEYPLAEEHIQKIKDNCWILETKVCHYDGVGRFVMGLLHEIVVLESESFKAYLKMRLSNVNIL